MKACSNRATTRIKLKDRALPRCFIAAFFLCIGIAGTSLKAEDERAQWIAERQETIENVRAGIGGKKEIEKLGTFLRGMGRKKDKLSPPVLDLYNEGRKALIATPGHAEVFAEEIRDMTESEIKGLYTKHPSQRAWNYQTLSHLQSPETVKVLGELLFDERDPWAAKDWGDGGRPYANSLHAVEALHTLGLHNAPVKGKFSSPEKDLRTWQLWFEQVRAGTRTFSFEEDDTIYSLSGPVSEAREPVAPLGERSRNPAAGPPADTGSGRKLWPVVAASALALLALFMALRKSKRLPAS